MRCMLPLLLIALVVSVRADAEADRAACATLDLCLAEMRALAKQPDFRDESMGQDEMALVKRLRQFDGAVPRLVAMLADPDERLASLAAKALRDARQIDPAYLPQIVAGLDRGLGWLAPALGRIPSDDAAREAVARLLVSEDAPENQEAYAVEVAGARAIPFIIEAARCAKGCGKTDHYYLGHVLGEMGPERAAAASGLMALAEDPATSDEIARGVLGMIARLGADGVSLEGRLLALRTHRPALGVAIDYALVDIGSEQAGSIFAERLRSEPDLLALRDLSETGPAGSGAGPVVVDLLTHPDWNIRLGAARAIGYIGYTDAAQSLIPLLDEESDVRLNWVAAESLGRLRASIAESALRRVSTDHWYPPVRDAATAALASIADGTPYESRFHARNFPFEFFAYESMGDGVPACKKTRSSLAAKQEPRGQKLYAKTDASRLEQLAYSTTVVSYGPAEEPKRQKGGKSQVIRLTPQNMVEHRNEVKQVPSLALRVDGGWLVGSDRGEWGGELAFVGDDGTQQIILNDNVEDIYFLGTRIVAVTGLAHLTSNDGALYEATRDRTGKWSVHPWRLLPGAPASSWLVATGELLVNTNSGSILVSPEGALRMAPCGANK